jgi:hypothetical protein
VLDYDFKVVERKMKGASNEKKRVKIKTLRSRSGRERRV